MRTLPLLLLLMAAPVAAEEAVQLDPVIIHGQPSPLDESHLSLRVMLARSTPCLGCDAVLAEPSPPPIAWLLREVLGRHRSPDDVDEADRLTFEIKLQDDPSLEFLRP